jgi:hypothetical protein
MVAVFVAALVAVEVYGGRRGPKGPDDLGVH